MGRLQQRKGQLPSCCYNTKGVVVHYMLARVRSLQWPCWDNARAHTCSCTQAMAQAHRNTHTGTCMCLCILHPQALTSMHTKPSTTPCLRAGLQPLCAPACAHTRWLCYCCSSCMQALGYCVVVSVRTRTALHRLHDALCCRCMWSVLPPCGVGCCGAALWGVVGLPDTLGHSCI